MKTLLMLLFSVLTISMYGQIKFPEKYKDCVKEEYIFEDDKQKVFIEDSNIIKTIQNNLLKGKEIEGNLVLVIGVDKEGRSCLFSADNNTNISTEELNLKYSIDRFLVWGKPLKKTITILAMTYKDHSVVIKRISKNKKVLYESESKN